MDFQTHSETTGFQETSRYPETIEFSKRLAAASDWIQYTTFGRSPEGRDLPLLIVSNEHIFTADEARRSNKIVILVLNGIHPGEIAGKEASFMLLREMAVTKQKQQLLENLILLVVPIYNVDGHERCGPYNRINQNGPKEMGWRTNSRNRNLNRDWIKAEESETRDLLKLYGSWLPHFVIDNHVSDGADFQYDLTYILDDNARVAPSLLGYLQGSFVPRIEKRMAEAGHTVAPYFELRDQTDPAAGLNIGPTTARFSNGYGTLQNRPTVTVETHMLKSFETRIRAHYDFMEIIFECFSREPAALRDAVRIADQETMRMANEYPVRLILNEEQSEPFVYRGIEYSRVLSPISGTMRVIYGKKPVAMQVRYFKSMEAEKTIVPPAGYLIGPQWKDAIACLQSHGIQFTRLKQEVSADFETYRFKNVSWNPGPFEGHFMARFETEKIVEHRTFPVDSLFIRLDQRTNKVIIEILEPDAADSLVAWGYFNAIFEDKEYAEAYILEDLAEKMFANDPLLAGEFQQLVWTDPTFASDPTARLNFFYARSPYRDARKNVYPIVRVTNSDSIQKAL